MEENFRIQMTFDRERDGDLFHAIGNLLQGVKKRNRVTRLKAVLMHALVATPATHSVLTEPGKLLTSASPPTPLGVSEPLSVQAKAVPSTKATSRKKKTGSEPTYAELMAKQLGDEVDFSY
jgi:hypothetical protein